MASLKFTRDDRKYLRSIHIDPEASENEIVFDALESLDQGRLMVIPKEMALRIIAEFGELTSKSIWAYHNKYKA